MILSLENHCSIQQQKKMARYLQEILGDKLDLGPVNIKEMKQLPSPNLLKGKILIKVLAWTSVLKFKPGQVYKEPDVLESLPGLGSAWLWCRRRPGGCLLRQEQKIWG